jgi:hypothetical protein
VDERTSRSSVRKKCINAAKVVLVIVHEA